MSIRNLKQEEFAKSYLNSEKSGILYLCPRFGKCRVAILIMKSLNVQNVLISYPNIDIKDSWEEEFKKVNWKPKVEYTTHISLKKHITKKYDIHIVDEIHLLSNAQIDVISENVGDNRILGLTGTMEYWTEKTLKSKLGLGVIARYSIKEAVADGILADYKINIATCKLDDINKRKFGKRITTEKKVFDSYTRAIERLVKEKKDTTFVRLGRARIIQESEEKVRVTKKLISEESERVLIFCSSIKVANMLGVPSYHSKSTDMNALRDFATGRGNKLAIIKKGNVGTTYLPLSKCIINSFDSNSENLTQKINRCMAIEYNNPDKIAEVWIVTTLEKIELDWLNKALSFFEESKISYYDYSKN